jgi:hypothetical protein
VAGGDVGGEFVVAAAQILDECVPGGEDPRPTGGVRRVDLLGRSLPAAPGADPPDSIRRYLSARQTKSAKALAAKAAVLIDPWDRAGEIVWPAGGLTRWRASVWFYSRELLLRCGCGCGGVGP